MGLDPTNIQGDGKRSFSGLNNSLHFDFYKDDGHRRAVHKVSI